MEYIGRNFSYRADIRRYLKNKIKTGFLSMTRPTVNGYVGELSSNQKFVWGKRVTEYVKQEKNIDRN